MEFTDEEIKVILEKHVTRQKYNREHYKKKYQEDEVHRSKVKQRAKEYYEKNKENICAHQKNRYYADLENERERKREYYWNKKAESALQSIKAI